MKGKAKQEEHNSVLEGQKMTELGMDDAQTSVPPTTQTLPTSSQQSIFFLHKPLRPTPIHHICYLILPKTVTLKPIFFEKLFHLKTFAEVVVAGEMLESGLKSGKIDGGEAAGFKKGQGNKKKETEVNFTSQEGYQPKTHMDIIIHHQAIVTHLNIP
ncbi:chaperonin 21 precursor [Corchorus olitorius]|uniref:Chaperonin 21 n=1 Tax=Corchorus olitorius TaxID=93759 RepID=A0A1R3K9Z4_9ROSI|nr:chaperonin 21 precursor [Corchorus olitorius]